MEPIRDDKAFRALRIVRDAGEEGCDLPRFVAAMWPAGECGRKGTSKGPARRGAGFVLSELARRGLCIRFGTRTTSLWRLTTAGERFVADQIAKMNAAAAARPAPAQGTPDDWAR